MKSDSAGSDPQGQAFLALEKMAFFLERGGALSAIDILRQTPWPQLEAGEGSKDTSGWERFLRGFGATQGARRAQERALFVEAALENRLFMAALGCHFLESARTGREIAPEAQRLRVAALAQFSAAPAFSAAMLAAGRGVARLQGGNPGLAQEFAQACPPGVFDAMPGRRALLESWAFATFPEKDPDLRARRQRFLSIWEKAGLVSPSDYLGAAQECASAKRHTSLAAQAGAILAERLGPSGATGGQWRSLAKKARARAGVFAPIAETQAFAELLFTLAEAADLSREIGRAKKTAAPRASGAGAKAKASGQGACCAEEPQRPRKPRML